MKYTVKEVMNLMEGLPVEMTCYVTKLATRTAKSGSKFLAGEMKDNTGSINIKCWNVPFDATTETLQKYITVCHITGTVNIFNGIPEIHVTSITPLKDTEYNIDDFLPRCLPEDKLSHYKARFDALYNEVKNEKLRKLILDCTNLDDCEFFKHTAACGNHHVGVGGLLVHSVSVAEKAHDLAYNVKDVNLDLVITGALLHDIGKIKEITTLSCVYTNTLEGRLLGHAIQGLMILEHFRNDIPANTFALLAHIIASHHGSIQTGALVEPMTLEATLISQADMLDYKEDVLRSIDETPTAKVGYLPNKVNEYLMYTTNETNKWIQEDNQ